MGLKKDLGYNSDWTLKNGQPSSPKVQKYVLELDKLYPNGLTQKEKRQAFEDIFNLEKTYNENIIKKQNLIKQFEGQWQMTENKLTLPQREAVTDSINQYVDGSEIHKPLIIHGKNTNLYNSLYALANGTANWSDNNTINSNLNKISKLNLELLDPKLKKVVLNISKQESESKLEKKMNDPIWLREHINKLYKNREKLFDASYNIPAELENDYNWINKEIKKHQEALEKIQ
tara:strand:- start:6624 stop:7316 length:693 start_codon:yes stop_codon:yes gene_type:complete